jgi:lipoyl-dependent peroxiredoxin
MKKSADAVWNGTLKEGSGSFTVESGAIVDQAYDFRTRFEDAPGTNPEELIAAAHASCFSMALSAELEKAEIAANRIATNCTITFENLTLTKSLLTTTVKALGADRSKVQAAAAAAKAGCPISRVLNLTIDLNLRIEV